VVGARHLFDKVTEAVRLFARNANAASCVTGSFGQAPESLGLLPAVADRFVRYRSLFLLINDHETRSRR